MPTKDYDPYAPKSYHPDTLHWKQVSGPPDPKLKIKNVHVYPNSKLPPPPPKPTRPKLYLDHNSGSMSPPARRKPYRVPSAKAIVNSYLAKARDCIVPSKKYHGKTVGQLNAFPEGRSYLKWILTQEWLRQNTRDAINLVLNAKETKTNVTPRSPNRKPRQPRPHQPTPEATFDKTWEDQSWDPDIPF